MQRRHFKSTLCYNKGCDTSAICNINVKANQSWGDGGKVEK